MARPAASKAVPQSETRDAEGGSGLDVAESGTLKAKEIEKSFREMLRASAELYAKRRGSRCLDNTDFEAAFRDLTRPRSRPIVYDIIAEAGLVGAGGLIAYSTTILTQASTSPAGVVMMITGILVGLASAIIKHVSPQ